jgi:hypothetical protein
VLYLVVGQHGAVLGFDETAYLGGAINLVQGNGFVQSDYDPVAQRIVLHPITHYPPLLSVSLAALMALGVPLLAAPAALALLCWVALLSGIGALTYRLTHSAGLSVLALALATVTFAYLNNFTRVASEVLFIPLLVWSMVLLVDLPQRERGVVPRLALVALLLAALLLTRFVGVIAWGSTLLWWGWCRLQQQQPRRLLYEWPLLGLAALPLGLFVLRNQFIATRVLGDHFAASESGFGEGLAAVFNQSSQLLLPALPGAAQWFVWNFVPGALRDSVIVVAGGLLVTLSYGVLFLLWRKARAQQPRQRLRWQPPRSPMLLILGFYLALYTLVQPFLSFYPIDDRDMMTVLCLAQPLLFAALGQAFQQHAQRVAAALVAANWLLLIVPVMLVALWGNLIALDPPRMVDQSHRMDEAWWYHRAGVPLWLLITPFRTTSLERYHPDVADYVREHEMQVATVTNSPRVALLLDSQHQPPPRLFHSVDDWLDEGSCTPPVDTAVIVFDWPNGSSYYIDAEQTRARIEQKCPQAVPISLEHSTIYELPGSGSAAARQ